MGARILFVELLGGVGDLIIALPAIHALAVSNPRAELTVLTFAPGSELLAADPLVHRVCRAERGDEQQADLPRRALEDLLAHERFDLVVTDTTYAGIASLLERSGARVISNLWRKPPPDQRIGERFLQILAEEGLIEPWAAHMRPRLSLDPADRLWAASQLTQPDRRAFLCPHAGMPIKSWPAERFVALGQALHEQFGLQIVVPEGKGAETEVSGRIATALRPAAFVLPCGSLPQFAAAATHADLAIGADTGPLRIAAAVGALTITLFGPSWHGRYGQPRPHINLQGFPACPKRVIADFTQQECWYAGRCPLKPWKSCLEDIPTGDVLEAARGLLGMTSWWGRPLLQHTKAGEIS